MYYLPSAHNFSTHSMMLYILCYLLLPSPGGFEGCPGPCPSLLCQARLPACRSPLLFSCLLRFTSLGTSHVSSPTRCYLLAGAERYYTENHAQPAWACDDCALLQVVHPAVVRCDMVLHRVFRARCVQKNGIGGDVRHGITSGVSCETSKP